MQAFIGLLFLLNLSLHLIQIIIQLLNAGKNSHYWQGFYNVKDLFYLWLEMYKDDYLDKMQRKVKEE